MSDSYSAGMWAYKASKTMEEKCLKGGRHKWKSMATGPSWWQQCTKCKVDIYGK